MRPFLAALLFASVTAHGVTLNADGLGQALIYPYYTVQSAGGNAFNTYITIVNHSADTKVLRVRFREARAGAEVLAFNLFLGARDAWAAAAVPLSSGTRLLTTDTSCADPAFTTGSPPFMDFRANAYQGDGSGDGIERTREGFVEVLEMATVGGVHREAVSPDLGTRNCALVQANPNVTVAPPTGDVSGTLTLINVASGLDFTLNAEALAGLATRAYFRVATDPYPDFNAAEIDAVSEVTANGVSYRSTWSRPVDAISAVLMRSNWLAEYVLESHTASLTDLVLTFPTRRFYATASSANAPFSRPLGWTANCESDVPGSPRGERVAFKSYNREEAAFDSSFSSGIPLAPPLPLYSLCALASVSPISNGQQHMPVLGEPSGVLGSTTQKRLLVLSSQANGWIDFRPVNSAVLGSLDSSTRVNTTTGGQAVGRHEYRGLPVVGFWARIFRNGTLQCSGDACQGNYGSAWPLRFQRNISPAS